MYYAVRRAAESNSEAPCNSGIYRGTRVDLRVLFERRNIQMIGRIKRQLIEFERLGVSSFNVNEISSTYSRHHFYPMAFA